MAGGGGKRPGWEEQTEGRQGGRSLGAGEQMWERWGTRRKGDRPQLCWEDCIKGMQAGEEASKGRKKDALGTSGKG